MKKDKIENLKNNEHLFEMEYEIDFKETNDEIKTEDKLKEVKIDGKKYTVLNEDKDSVLVEVEVLDNKGVLKLHKQWFYKSVIEQ